MATAWQIRPRPPIQASKSSPCTALRAPGKANCERLPKKSDARQHPVTQNRAVQPHAIPLPGPSVLVPSQSHFRFFLLRLDQLLARVTSAAAVLVVPLALLLCAQWPLRDGLHAYSREANDLAQLVFGIYVSVGIMAATRAHFHLTPDVVARRYPVRVRRWISQAASIGIVAPWALFNLYASVPSVWQSIRQMEHFPESGNPGYFILKACIWLLGLLVLLQAAADVFTPATGSTEGRH